MKAFQIFLLVLIVIGLGLIFTQKVWAPRLAEKIIEMENDIPKPLPESVGEFWGAIFGTVMLGPVCPVMQDPPDPECADRPYSTTLALTTPDGARVIKTFSSDTQGKFYIEVPPGQYAIRSAAAANILPYCSAEAFTVKLNDSLEIAVSCDSGIR